MYDQSVILRLNKRVGWVAPSDSYFSVPITEDNKLSESGRNYEGFHYSTTLSNIYHSQGYIDSDEVKFNEYLGWMGNQNVLAVLSNIFNNSDFSCINNSDYSGDILENLASFDDAIGLGMSIRAIELMITSSRSNFISKVGKVNYSKFKSELEGYFDNGEIVVDGLRQKYDKAIVKTAKIFCSGDSVIGVRDGTNNW